MIAAAPNCSELVNKLTEAVHNNVASAILLSGGLDSAIITCIARPQYSVVAGLGVDAPDLASARNVAEKYCKHHVEAIFDFATMVELVDIVVQTFNTFDPIEIRNSCVALAALKQAKKDGHLKVMTGDGGDELFAGYNYLARYYDNLEMLDQELGRLWDVMHFSSIELGRRVGVEVKMPFLDAEFLRYAKSIPSKYKVGRYEGRSWGKFALRKCFENELGNIVWRKKMAQEQGAGTDRFVQYIDKMIDDATFSSKARVALSEGVRLRNKEHLHYYAMYRSYNPPPREVENWQSRRCPECQGYFKWSGKFCRTCGAFPVTPTSLF